jgi:hypothetical protein
MAQQPLPAGMNAQLAPLLPIPQGIAMIGGGAAPAAPVQAPITHRTFASLYADASKDPLHDRYAAVMQRFDAEAPQALVGADLLQSTLDNAMTPNTSLCCTSLHAGTPARIYLIHAMSRYPQAPDGTVSHWDNRIFCYLGELLQEAATIVAIPAMAFNSLNNVVRVYKEDALELQLAQLPDDALFPRLAANAANGMNLRTRYILRLRVKYAPLLLSPKGYSPRSAYAILSAALSADNVLDITNPIMNWLRVSLHASLQNQQGPPANTIAITAPFVDEDLINHRLPLLNHLLSG